MLRLPRALAIAVAPLCCATPALAQQGWVADLYAGRAMHETVAANLDVTSLIGGVRRGTPTTSWLYAAVAAPLADDSPPWAAAGAQRRIPAWSRLVPELTVGLDLGGHAYAFRDAALDAFGTGITLDGGAFLATSHRRLRGEAHAGWRRHLADFDGEKSARGAIETGVRVESRSAVRMGASVRWLRVAEDGYGVAAADVAAAVGPIGVALGAERWLHSELDDTGWSASAIVPLGVADLWGSLRHDARDPFFGTPRRRTWNIGVSRRFGARPVAAAVATMRDGQALVRLPLAASPAGASVAGDFTDWQPRAMAQSGNYWELRLPLPPGVYRYAFVDAEGRWFVPESVPGRMDDGMGGHVAVLIVP